MGIRAERKQASLKRILDAASVRLRQEGLGGAAIAPVMKEAGLTHGAFYSHFENKEEQARAAFEHALDTSQPSWFGTGRESWRKRLVRMAKRYLSRSHRDDVGHGCPVAALVAEVPGASDEFRKTFGMRVADTLERICEVEGEVADKRRYDEAIVFLALCVGGLTLSRAMDDAALSDRILEVCRRHIESIGDG